MTRTPDRVLAKITDRDGHRCAWTGEDHDGLVPQHRQGGMGGRRDKHQLANVLWLDSIINGLIESDPEWQREAVRRGIKISGFDKPTEVPVLHAVHGLVYLDNEGGARSGPHPHNQA